MRSKTDAILNVVVFSPLAFYLARGKTPPMPLIVASLTYTGVMFLRDLQILMGRDTPPLPGTPPIIDTYSLPQNVRAYEER